VACRAWLAGNGGGRSRGCNKRATRSCVTIRVEHRRTKADLTNGEYRIEPEAWDLIAICYYLQRDLFEPAKRGLAEGGVLLAIVHITEDGEAPTEHRLAPGELVRYFDGLEILHHYEGAPNDSAHRRPVAEVVARRVARSPGRAAF
jgi:hypothetical protein